MRGAWVAAAVLVLGLSVPAHADRIGTQAQQLRTAADYKIRLSAALGLSRAHDGRAISALIEGLDDREATVRRVAALGLGKAIGSRTDEELRERALERLSEAAEKDRDRQVRSGAKKSLAKLEGRNRRGSPAAFVQVAEMEDSTRKLPREARGAVFSTLRSTLRRHAPMVELSSPREPLPSKADLNRRGLQGFYVGSRVSKLDIKRNGRQAEIRCSVSVRVSTWTGRDGGERMQAGKAASASGNGKVVGDGSRAGIEQSAKDCVMAVVEQVAADQVGPFLSRLLARR